MTAIDYKHLFVFVERRADMMRPIAVPLAKAIKNVPRRYGITVPVLIKFKYLQYVHIFTVVTRAILRNPV